MINKNRPSQYEIVAQGQNRMIEKLQAAEKRYADLVGHLTDIVFHIDDQLRWTYLNEAWFKITGHFVRDSLGQSLSDFIPSSSTLFTQLLEGKKSHLKENIILLCASGDKKRVEVFCRPMKNEMGQYKSIIGTLSDITKQDLPEQLLAESRRKLDFERLQLKALIKAIPDLVWLKDVNGVFLNCNSRIESLFGIKAEDILGKTDYDFFDTAVADSFRFHDKAAMQSKSPLVNEEQLTFPDGHTELIETTKTPIFDEDGKIIGVMGLGRNITKRKQDESKLEQKIKLRTTELKESQERLAFAVEGVGDGIWDWNIQTNQVNYSKRWKEMLGYAENEIKNEFSEWQRLVHPNDIGEALSRVQEFLKNKTKIYESEFRMQHKNGQYITILARAFAIGDEDGKIISLLGTHSDITGRRLTEEKLELAASVFSHAGEGITISDATQTIVDVNDAFLAITGYSRQDVIGHSTRMIQSAARQPPEFYTEMWQAIDTTGTWTGEIWNRRKDGEVYAAKLTKSVVRNDAGKVNHYVTLFSDITDQKEHQSQLERMANYDALTNIPNRTLLADRLNQAILESHRHHNSLAVVFLDLDDFKDVNDTHGHDVGDELLIALSVRMKEALREGDTLARIGGDEFVVVLANLAKVEDCQPALDRLLLATSEPIKVGDLVLRLSASIGVAFYPKDGVEADTLMRHADQAMYGAKKEGKNQYHMFDTVHDDEVKTQRKSLADIGLAFEGNEFVLYYQPKVNMSTGDVVGVEALIRWQHPTRGLVPPLDFLPIIEGHALSLAVGKWVIDTALGQISQWQSMGLMLPISVNISAHQLQQTDFVTCLEALLANHSDVSPDQLELEVLESTALTDVKLVPTTMHACRELGVQFALDDFGTGYSSLTHLRRLPASLIKIDQSFVRDMLVDPDDLAIIVGVISLAKAFKRNVIAEGVETIQHGTELLQLGCELAQGFGIAKPMPAADIAEWMSNWKVHDAWLEVGVK